MKKENRNTFRGKIVSGYQKQKESRGGFGYLNLPKGVEMFKFPDGVRSFQLDFVPYIVSNAKHLDRNISVGAAMPDCPWYRLPIRVHRNVGGNNESILCPTTFGKKCPICEFRVKRIKEGASKEEFKVFYPQERSIYPVIPIGHKDYDEVPYVWDMADFLFQETLIDELKEDETNEDFFTLENGKVADLRLKWKKIGENSFPEVVSITFSDREPYDNKLLDEVPALDDLLKMLSYEEISAKFFEEEEPVGDEEDGGELKDVEDEPKSFRRRTRATVDKEEEEEAPPTRSRRRRPATEEEEPESEPEESKEVRRTRRGKSPVKEETTGKCPNKHEFGKDFEKYDDCEECDSWNDCYDESKQK